MGDRPGHPTDEGMKKGSTLGKALETQGETPHMKTEIEKKKPYGPGGTFEEKREACERSGRHGRKGSRLFKERSAKGNNLFAGGVG